MTPPRDILLPKPPGTSRVNEVQDISGVEQNEEEGSEYTKDYEVNDNAHITDMGFYIYAESHITRNKIIFLFK